MTIIKGTTPTIQYKFNVVHVTDISKAYLTITGGPEPIEKDLDSATIGTNTISWTLTQQETLSFAGTVQVMLNWLTTGGTRGASKKTMIVVESNLKEVVIDV